MLGVVVLVVHTLIPVVYTLIPVLRSLKQSDFSVQGKSGLQNEFPDISVTQRNPVLKNQIKKKKKN